MHASQHHDRRRRPAPPEEASSRNGLRNQSDADERLAHRGTCRPIRRCARQVIPRGRALLLPALLVLLLAGRRGPGHLDASAPVPSGLAHAATPPPALTVPALEGAASPTGAVGIMLTLTPGALVARVLVGAYTPTIMLTTMPPAPPPVPVLAGGCQMRQETLYAPRRRPRDDSTCRAPGHAPASS